MNKVGIAVGSIFVIVVSLIAYLCVGEYHIFETGILLGIVIGLLIIWLKRGKVYKDHFQRTRSNKMDKESKEYLAYKRQAHSIWGYIIVLLVAYLILLMVGVFTGQYHL